ncbi:hypothetical protein ACJX0J_010598, partial [Zea mays]
MSHVMPAQRKIYCPMMVTGFSIFHHIVGSREKGVLVGRNAQLSYELAKKSLLCSLMVELQEDFKIVLLRFTILAQLPLAVGFQA